MSPLFGKKCSQCGANNPLDSGFCNQCGTPFSGGGGRKCGHCGKDNPKDAEFCRGCGRSLNSFAEVEVHKNHWARRENDFAARLEISDLPGLLTKNLEVETGTQALVFGNGTPQEILPPGVYTMDSVGKTISNWFAGVPKAVSVLLVEASPKEIIIPIENRYTSDPLPISLSIRMIVEVDEAAKFMIAALRNRERYSLEDLRSYIQPEVASATDDYLRKHTLEQLVENPATRDEIELAVEERLRSTFKQYGIKLIYLRTVEMDLEAYDKIKGIKGKYSLIVSEGKAELDGKEALLILQKDINLQELAEKTVAVEKSERLAELNKRIHDAALSEKMDEVRSEVDFEKFLNEIDIQKLLSKKERDDLIKKWKEEAEDHDRARATLLARTELEEKYQLRAAEIRSRGELSTLEQEYELQLERKRVEMSIEVEEQKWTADLKKQRAIDEYANQKASNDVDLFIKFKREKMLLENEDADLAVARRLNEARANIDLEIQRLDSEHKREMERLEKLAVLGSEALISISPVEQAKIIQDLKRVETLKDMSEDQILALAAEKNPELGKVFEEKYRAIAEGKASERDREMYEKMLAGNEANQQQLMSYQKEVMDRMQKMSEHDVDAIKEVSMAYAKQGTPPVIIAGAGGGSVAQATRSGFAESSEEKGCPICGRHVPVNSRFCPYCNNQFKDQK